jgi:alkanesulfonate monooxygenase SsuD/methylene tetrahydromethanopterin reductase-like flavin-dependent oxidoreductase (luciferase family)
VRKNNAGLSAPQGSIGVFVICAESEERAQYLAASRDLSRLRQRQGMPMPFPPPEDALINYKWFLRLAPRLLPLELEGEPVAIEPGLGNDDQLDQLLQFFQMHTRLGCFSTTLK